MGRVLRALACFGALAAVLLGARVAKAVDWELSLDGRLVDSDGQKSFLDGGLGALRWGEDKSGVRLGRARFALSETFFEILALKLDASYWGDNDKNPIDLTEAYFELRPYPRAGFRTRVKAGAFYAPLSLENHAPGWESPYTLSYSALDSWIAEELRTIGLEADVDWLGTKLGHSFDVGLTAAVFGWNEPAGVSLAMHGFAVDDHQTTLFGRVGVEGGVPVAGFEEFREIDGRAGTYFGVNARYLDRITFRALHYDNHADPAAFDPVSGAHAWATRFDTAGVRAEGTGGWTAIVQWMQGETYVAPSGQEHEWDFTTRYLLLSEQIGKHTLSARYDQFHVTPEAPTNKGRQTGDAWTVSYLYEPNRHWRFAIEWLSVHSSQSNREIYLAESPLATETMLQLAIRYAIGST